MSCSHVHDFIKGTTIALPRAVVSQSPDREVFDILRPSSKAAVLVSQHTETLNRLSINRKPKDALH